MKLRIALIIMGDMTIFNNQVTMQLWYSCIPYRDCCDNIINEGHTVTVQVLVINIGNYLSRIRINGFAKQHQATHRALPSYKCSLEGWRPGARPTRIPPPNTSHETRLSVGIINALLPMPHTPSEIDYTQLVHIELFEQLCIFTICLVINI